MEEFPDETESEADEPEEEAEGEEEGPSKKTNLQWDTTQVADGRYVIRVVVSDRTSNPQEPETDEQLSDPILVDNTPPVLLLEPGSEAVAPPETVRASDAISYIASAEFKVDKDPWTGAACADRVFDSPYEDLLLNLSEVKPGEHTLSLRVRDAAGNETLREVKILVPERNEAE